MITWIPDRGSHANDHNCRSSKIWQTNAHDIGLLLTHEHSKTVAQGLSYSTARFGISVWRANLLGTQSQNDIITSFRHHVTIGNSHDFYATQQPGCLNRCKALFIGSFLLNRKCECCRLVFMIYSYC